MPDLETIIGLEVHAQMNTKTKMFCGCGNDAFGKPPNSLVCPVCMGHPGTLPVPNKASIEKAVRAALALKCAVRTHNYFSRKNYFYPDLPAGYQISQYDFPLAEHGKVEFEQEPGKKLICGIIRLHMENDAGKLMHRGEASLCDYNRAGTPLMEIVTEPDLRSPKEAVAFVQELRRILISVNASEADMFKGMMRFDASISLREKGEKKLHPRSEIKNLNSFKSLEKALLYEEARLRKQWEKEGPPKGEITVGWLDDEEKTVMLRDKESAADYRYFPEPDIPPLSIDDAMLKNVGKDLAELPQEIKARYIALGLGNDEATILLDQPILRVMFDTVYEKTRDAKRTSSLLITQLQGFLKAEDKSIAEGPDAGAILGLIESIDSGTISANAGKEVLEAMVKTDKSAQAIIEEKDMKQISDDGALAAIVEKAVAANPRAIASYKAGKEAALGAVVGWIMKETRGQANPKKITEMLMKRIADSG